MRTIVTLVLVLLVMTPRPIAGLASEDTPVLERYMCTGETRSNPLEKSKEYKLVLDVERFKDNYALTWFSNRVQSRGIGFRKGDTLSVTFVMENGNLGVVSYAISVGKLAGGWAFGDGQIYPENCEKGGEDVPMPQSITPPTEPYEHKNSAPTKRELV